MAEAEVGRVVGRDRVEDGGEARSRLDAFQLLGHLLLPGRGFRRRPEECHGAVVSGEVLGHGLLSRRHQHSLKINAR